MKRMVAIAGALGVAVMIGTAVEAADPQQQSFQRTSENRTSMVQPRAGSESQGQSAIGTVADIDQERRIFTLELASGQRLKLQADPSVQNLDQIKKGDRVAVNYDQNSALDVRKAG